MRLLQATASSVGSKILIAFTGLAMAVFLVGHLGGNLLFLVGPEAFNHYGHALTSNPLVYVAEMGLIAVFLLHIGKTLAGYLANRSARPEPYAKKRWARTKSSRSRKSLSSTTMIVTGTITALFVVTHLLTFKFGPNYQAPDGIRDLYRLQVEVFSQPLYVLFYLVAMFIIFSHLWHGISSAAQSLGIDHARWTPRIVWTGRILSLAIAGGFFVLPIFTFFISRGAR
ncbi:MAG TPA: succinate dehydrogenase cytochrome b subunit [Vicinamibacterales bacterium]|nr:succinate dehydrogenase cytochrome b subunit [Vicinamibacterales bacterium]